MQIADHVASDVYSRLRDAVPSVKLLQVIHAGGEESVAEAATAAERVDAVLLDSGNPSLAVKELGGMGRVHDWSPSKRIRGLIGVPLFLAGGLRAENVREAIRSVQPFGLDLCSGVRTAGRLDESKLAAFMESV